MEMCRKRCRCFAVTLAFGARNLVGSEVTHACPSVRTMVRKRAVPPPALASSEDSAPGGATCCGPLLIDHAAHEVSIDDRALVLTAREYELLQFLAMNPRRVYTRHALLTILGSKRGAVGVRTIDGHVRGVRAKLGPDLRDCIRTVRGVGYGFYADAMAGRS